MHKNAYTASSTVHRKVEKRICVSTCPRIKVEQKFSAEKIF
jgi:hypothetical protein